ncbi:MAG TPA: hypothetical protein VGD79_01360 [Thermoanaerobaculia bacterium]|jgi:hypothetical protein
MPHHCTFWAYVVHALVAAVFGPLIALSILQLPPFNKHERNWAVTFLEVALVAVAETILVTYIVCMGGQ